MIDKEYLASVSSVLFVCMGNICRSPTAEAVFTRQAKLFDLHLHIDSAGTIAYHQGNKPDKRSVEVGSKRGLNFSGMKARQVCDSDFEAFDLILAADESNLTDLLERCPRHFHYKLHLILAFSDGGVRDVPDPYYGGDSGFELVIDLLETSLAALATQLASAKNRM
ncbi:low molecular weight protein-tyrosine-phosphatase [Shewanella sp. A14]